MYIYIYFHPVVFFHSRVVTGIETNRTKRARKSRSYLYSSSSTSFHFSTRSYYDYPPPTPFPLLLHPNYICLSLYGNVYFLP